MGKLGGPHPPYPTIITLFRSCSLSYALLSSRFSITGFQLLISTCTLQQLVISVVEDDCPLAVYLTIF
jgi:hypothetical protein